PPDHLEHLFLDVLGIDNPVWPDALREPHGEPTARRAEVGDDGAFGDFERVHDLVRPVPLLTIGAFEDAEVQWRKKPAASLSRVGGTGRMSGKGEQRHERRNPEGPLHSRPALRALPASLAPFFSPTTPPLVIDSTERISSSFDASRRPRSRTSSR